MDAREIALSDIVIRNRIRKDHGDLRGLCESIESVGLLHPIVLNPKRELIAGLRRISAFKELGRKKIPAVIISNLSDVAKLTAERDENDCRLDLTTLEAVAMGRAIEELEKPKAKDRQKLHGGTAPGKKNTSENFTEVKGETREIVGAAIGMSGPTYQRAKFVAVAAEQDPDTFGPIAEEMDRDGKVKRAYDRVVEIKKGKRPVPKSTNANGKQPVGVLRANEAIDCLMRIPKNDAHRKRGFQIVTDWIKHNR